MNDPDFDANFEAQLDDLQSQRDRLFGMGTMLISARSQQDFPEMGVTPFIRHDGDFFIYPSHLASHVRAMMDRDVAQFMIIEDEATAQNIWARRRLKFFATFAEISREDALFAILCEKFAERHGPTIGVIRDFSDFHMLRLTPTSGVMVLGFAKAFALQGPSLDIVARLKKT